MADISTLGVTYGVSISAASLKAILDANNIVEVTGSVVVDTASSPLITENADLEITGSGSINTVDDVQIKAIKRWIGVDINANVLYLEAEGATVQGCTIPGYAWHINNCIIGGVGADRVTVTRQVRANGSDNRVNADFVAPDGSACSLKFGGPVSKLGIPWNEFEWKSSCRNDMRGSTFAGGNEETCGFDAMNSGLVEGWGTCTRSGDDITVTVLGSNASVNAGELIDSLDGPYSAVGTHVLVMSGAAQGNYYEVTAQSGHTLTLGTSRFSTAGIANGDHVSFGSSHVENNWSETSIDQNSIYQRTHQEAGTWEHYGFDEEGADIVDNAFHVGLSFFGRCYGNITEDITAVDTGTGFSVGVCDSSFIYKATQGIASAPFYDFKLNSRNIWRRNNVSGFSQDFQIWTCVQTSPDWESFPPDAVPYSFRGYGAIFEDNDFAIASIWNVKDAVCSGNSTALVTNNTGQISSARNDWYLSGNFTVVVNMAGDTTFAALKKLKVIGGKIKVIGGKIKVR